MCKEYNQNDFKNLFDNKLSSIEARDMLVDMYQKGESDTQIAIAAKMMREHALKLPLSDELKGKVVDNCGTGGDKSNSFNISTTVALLCSGVGSIVAKHGNTSITSKSGSADMLDALGVNINLSPLQQVKMLEDIRFAFIYAKNHHSIMKFIMPIRQSIPHRTIFNILGPIASPAGAKKQLIGVFDKDFVIKIANALKILESKESMVLSGKDGMDEITISDITYFAHLRENKITEGIIDPQKLGFKLYDKSEIIGGSPKQNAKITYDILSGNLVGAKKDIVLLNAGFLLVIDSVARDFQDAKDMLNECIDSKMAKKHLEQIIEISNKI